MKRIRLIAILFSLFVLFGCSSTSKVSYLSKKKLEKNEITVSRVGSVPFEISDCAAGIIVIPINPLIDFDKELENKCGENWEIFDLEQKETKFSIPLIYGQYCRTVRGSCKKD